MRTLNGSGWELGQFVLKTTRELLLSEATQSLSEMERKAREAVMQLGRFVLVGRLAIPIPIHIERGSQNLVEDYQGRLGAQTRGNPERCCCQCNQSQANRKCRQGRRTMCHLCPASCDARARQTSLPAPMVRIWLYLTNLEVQTEKVGLPFLPMRG
jgi:hypothetical protein